MTGKASRPRGARPSVYALHARAQLVTDANALCATQPERFAKQPANNVSLCPTASSLTRSTAAPLGTFRRAGHAAPCAVGPVARERGNWAATLRRPPRESRLPGAASAPSHRKIRIPKTAKMV